MSWITAQVKITKEDSRTGRKAVYVIEQALCMDKVSAVLKGVPENNVGLKIGSQIVWTLMDHGAFMAWLREHHTVADLTHICVAEVGP